MSSVTVQTIFKLCISAIVFVMGFAFVGTFSADAYHCDTNWHPDSEYSNECPATTDAGVSNGGNTTSGVNTAGNTGAGTANPGNTDSGSGNSVKLFDPLNKSIEDIFRAILDIIMVFAVPIILFFIVWAGFLYVTAAGSETQIQKATQALTWAVIGGLIVLGANVLLAVITNTIKLFA